MDECEQEVAKGALTLTEVHTIVPVWAWRLGNIGVVLSSWVVLWGEHLVFMVALPLCTLSLFERQLYCSGTTCWDSSHSGVGPGITQRFSCTHQQVVANCISAGKVMEDIQMADTCDSAKVLVIQYTKVTYCGTPQDLCWYLYLLMLDLCVLRMPYM